MNVDELYSFSVWIQEEITDKSIPSLFSNLHSKLQNNAQPNTSKQPFQDEKEKLIHSLRDISIHHLTKEQLNLLDRLDIAPYLGDRGVTYIEDALVNDALDIVSASEKIQGALNQVNAGVDKAKKMRASLSDLVDGKYEPPEGDQVLIRVTFRGDASIENMKDLKDWGDNWYEIARGVTMATGKAPEDIRIIGASKGSIIFDAVSVYAIAKVLSFIVLECLKVREKVIDIRKKSKEVRSLQLQNNKIADDLNKEAENHKEKAVDSILDQICKKLKIKKNGDGDVVANLRKAINNFIVFSEKGGDIDIIPPEEPEYAADEEGEDGAAVPNEIAELRRQMEELTTTVEEIRLLESKHLELEPGE